MSDRVMGGPLDRDDRAMRNKYLSFDCNLHLKNAIWSGLISSGFASGLNHKYFASWNKLSALRWQMIRICIIYTGQIAHGCGGQMSLIAVSNEKERTLAKKGQLHQWFHRKNSVTIYTTINVASTCTNNSTNSARYLCMVNLNY